MYLEKLDPVQTGTVRCAKEFLLILEQSDLNQGLACPKLDYTNPSQISESWKVMYEGNQK